VSYTQVNVTPEHVGAEMFKAMLDDEKGWDAWVRDIK
jgi:hypothetical protein